MYNTIGELNVEPSNEFVKLSGTSKYVRTVRKLCQWSLYWVFFCYWL